MKLKIAGMIMFFVIFSQINYATNTLYDDKLKSFNNSVTEESIGNYKEAIDELISIYSNYKEDYLINLRLGWLYYQSNDYNKSIQYYNQAVRISSGSIEAFLGLTYPYSAINKWDEVENIYDKILAKDKNNYSANLYLARIYLNNGDYLNGKVLLEKIFENYPSDYNINLSLGWAYYYLGDKGKAQRLFTTALIASPNDSYAIEGLKLTK